MIEWQDPFNSFNSWKILLWREHLEACAKGNYLPPVSVDIDPANCCNYDCNYCNAYDVMHGDIMPEKHMLDLADMYAEWGVKSCCCAGGGEPLINNGTPAFLERMKSNGLESGLITNGSLLTKEKHEAILRSCAWVGISIDAGHSETYGKIKRVNPQYFFDVLENIRTMIRTRDWLSLDTEITYKYLLTPENAMEIYDAAVYACEIGFTKFHLRPAGFDNLSKTKDTEKTFTPELIDMVNRQIEAAMQLKGLQFFGVRHKFNPDFSRKVNFSRCWAIPMIPTFSADGNVYLCFDMRGKYPMCRHDMDCREILGYWNTDAHRELVRSIKPENCPRCTFGFYNEAVEKVIIKDGMHRNFP
jgi:MoaA/NifB/PqqE/SkfB family radical SAM enzyme